MTNLRDYNREVNLETTEALVAEAINEELECYQAQGGLNDSYIIFNNRTLTFKGVKARKYILLYPRYLNEWSNSLHVTFTDNFEKVKNFFENYGFEGESLLEIEEI